MALARYITYRQLRKVLLDVGFRERRRDNGVALKHLKSDTVFLFRPYEPTDRMQPAEIFLVTQELDARGLLEPESFEALLTRAPA
jgi:hypothetical protein